MKPHEGFAIEALVGDPSFRLKSGFTQDDAEL
jgi:hypothetical protein